MLGFPGAASSAPTASSEALLSVPSPQEAECKKEMLDVKFMADTKIADSKRAFELQKAAFTEEVNIKVRVSHSLLLFPGGPVMVLVALGFISFLLLHLLGEMGMENRGLCVTVSSLQQIPLLFAAIWWDLEKRKVWGGLNLELVGLKCCGRAALRIGMSPLGKGSIAGAMSGLGVLMSAYRSSWPGLLFSSPPRADCRGPAGLRAPERPGAAEDPTGGD